jgi:hypothetical protein
VIVPVATLMPLGLASIPLGMGYYHSLGSDCWIAGGEHSEQSLR